MARKRKVILDDFEYRIIVRHQISIKYKEQAYHLLQHNNIRRNLRKQKIRVFIT